jgi:hypothetical protein
LNPPNPLHGSPLSGKRTTVHFHSTAQHAEISITARWGTIDLSIRLRMLLPSIGSRPHYAVCPHNNPIPSTQLPAGPPSLARSVRLPGSAAGIRLMTSFLYLPVDKLAHNLPTTTIVAPPRNVIKRQMAFNSAFKGLRYRIAVTWLAVCCLIVLGCLFG